MMMVLIIVTQKLLIKLDLLVAIINISNAKHLKKVDEELSGVSGFFWCFLDWDIKTVGVVNNLRAMEQYTDGGYQNRLDFK